MNKEQHRQVNTEQVHHEITNGDGIKLSQAARLFPSNRNGRPVTSSCIVRWVLDGVNGPSGSRIKLEAVRVAGKWMTTPQAITRFIELQNPQIDGTPKQIYVSPKARTRRSQAASDELDRLGF